MAGGAKLKKKDLLTIKTAAGVHYVPVISALAGNVSESQLR